MKKMLKDKREEQNECRMVNKVTGDLHHILLFETCGLHGDEDMGLEKIQAVDVVRRKKAQDYQT